MLRYWRRTWKSSVARGCARHHLAGGPLEQRDVLGEAVLVEVADDRPDLGGRRACR